ncbi:MAG: DUF3850 domain-containing protein [Clostridia bacterium]|nr:DUF3850 domain-containing protein [Clostridia bacterium]
MKDIFILHLNHEYFEKIKAGVKTIELRVNDAKRKKYEVGNILEFVSRDDESLKMRAEITGLFYFANVRDAVESVGKASLGFDSKLTTDKIEDIYLGFYRQEEIDKSGVVAIQIKLLD